MHLPDAPSWQIPIKPPDVLCQGAWMTEHETIFTWPVILPLLLIAIAKVIILLTLHIVDLAYGEELFNTQVAFIRERWSSKQRASFPGISCLEILYHDVVHACIENENKTTKCRHICHWKSGLCSLVFSTSGGGLEATYVVFRQLCVSTIASV